MRRVVPLSMLVAALVLSPAAPALAMPHSPAASAARASTSIRLDARTHLLIPAGAMPSGAYILVDRLADRRARRDHGLVGRAVRIRLMGARHLRRPARIEYRVPDRLIGRRVHIALWDAKGRRWQRQRTRVDRRRGVAWARMRQLAPASTRRKAGAAISVSFGLGVIAEWGQFWGEVLGARAGRPNCTSETPHWVESVTFVNHPAEPAFVCGMRDPGKPNVAEVRVVNNRSYGMWLSFDRAQPDWAWMNLGGIFWPELKRLLYSRGLSLGPHENDIYLPPTTEIHLGFSEHGRDNLGIRVTPAYDMKVVSAAISILSNRIVGLGRARMALAPLFACDVAADNAIGTIGGGNDAQSAIDLGRSAIGCARKVIDEVAARKMAYLDTATYSWLSLKKPILGTLAAALGIVDLSYAGADLFEMSTGRSTTVTVKHSAMPSPAPGPTAPPPAPGSQPQPAPPTAPKPSVWNLQVVVYGGGHVGMSFNVGWQEGRDPVICHFFRDGVEVFTAQCGTHSSKQFYGVPAGRHSFYATVSDRYGVFSDPTATIVRDTS